MIAVPPMKYKGRHLPYDKHTVQFNINNEKIKLNLTLSARDVMSYKIPVWIVKSTRGQSSKFTYELVKHVSTIQLYQII